MKFGWQESPTPSDTQMKQKIKMATENSEFVHRVSNNGNYFVIQPGQKLDPIAVAKIQASKIGLFANEVASLSQST